MSAFTESVVAEAALELFENLHYGVAYGHDIGPGGVAQERDSWGQVILESRLRVALARLNPSLPAEALDDAFRRLTRPELPSLVATNHHAHRMVVEGVAVEFRRPDGSIGGAQVSVIDFERPANNDWLAVNQYTVVEDRHNRRPDVVVFVNGLPLAVLELKNAADENATIDGAFNQLQTYKQEIPSLFALNEALVISDGTQARVGALTADRERFMPWRTIEGQETASPAMAELQVVIEGVFDKRRFLDLVRFFAVFEDQGGGVLMKKLAGYHQFHAVNVAVEETLRACAEETIRHFAEPQGRYAARRQEDAEPGDRRIGVVWHTQGSGKSLTMAFFAGRVIAEPEMGNPTVVVITDRNDLDDQLFGTFAQCRELLRQDPVQAQDRADLRRKLQVDAGGVVFTTIQKFFPDEHGDRHPVLSERRNIVVIADEAHRSQYDFIDGFAVHMREALPNASFIGFTGTPIELSDKNTRAVFGDYISIYDIQRAVEDGATVPIYYESRLARIELDPTEAPHLDAEFEEVTEGEEVERKERLKTKWAQLEALVGSEKRLELVAKDLVDHFEARLADGMDGKAMVVCMSRRIAMDLHDRIRELRPDWYDADDDRGVVKVVMTGSADEGPRVAEHSRSKSRREALAKRFRDPQDPLRVVIVRDMWLTGFDAPCLHTMYVDKPMRGHGLMQAIARVNRVFRDKPGGLVVDYIGLADQLKSALASYTENGGKGETALDKDEAVAFMQQQYEISCGMFHGFDWRSALYGTATQRMSLIPAAQEHILAQTDGKERLSQAVAELSQAFALAVPSDEALAIREDVGFFQSVKAALTKGAERDGRSDEELEHAVRQLVSKAVTPGEVVDIFAAAGLERPNISVLSDEFLAEVRGMQHRNLAIETLRKLLAGEISTRSRRNVVQGRSFLEMLNNAIRRYQSRAIESAQVIDELIALAKEMREAAQRGEHLGLSDDELAFYDALAANASAVEVMGDETLRTLARELVERVKANVTIDWKYRENVRAQLRVIVRRLLRQYGYPPDKQEAATETVLQQAEVLSEEWLAA